MDERLEGRLETASNENIGDRTHLVTSPELIENTIK